MPIFKFFLMTFLLIGTFGDFKEIDGTSCSLGSAQPGMFSKIGLVTGAKSVKIEAL
jgi:hypothetical protein